jgi:Raf kinase inhibitor-like YbhB/YbcL family protein
MCVKVVILFLLLVLISSCDKSQETAPLAQEPVKELVSGGETMKLTSNDFNQGDLIPKEFTCQGDDFNPHLAWEDAPANTKSFALIVDDPDAPVGLWVHWLVKDIPANIKEIKQDSVPGNQVENDFGKKDYGGPCPPSGVHRYVFKLYALDVENLDVNNKKEFYAEAEKHAIAKAELMGTYRKS